MKSWPLVVILILVTAGCFSQTYPYHEGFEGQISSQVPTGWSGHIKVLGYHGLNDGKGLAAAMGSTNLHDSIISPLIGPLTNHSQLIFFYRIVDQYIYPSTPTDLQAGDDFEVQLSTDSVTGFQTILHVDENNHTTNLNFAKKKVYVAQFAGQSVYFKFRADFGLASSGYYVDVDSVTVNDDPLYNGVQSPAVQTVQLYPNPCNNVCTVTALLNQPAMLQVFDITGRKVFETSFSGYTNLPVDAWDKGMYIVAVEQNGQTNINRLVLGNN